jgi:hypothetical protein
MRDRGVGTSPQNRVTKHKSRIRSILVVDLWNDLVVDKSFWNRLTQSVDACAPNAEHRCGLGVDIWQLDTVVSIRDTGCCFQSPSSVFVILGDPIAANMSRCTLAN